MNRSMASCILLIAAVRFAAGAALGAAPPTYHMTEFGGDDSPTKFTTVTGPNDLGEMLITVYGVSSSQAYLSIDGTMKPVSSLKGFSGICAPDPSYEGGALNDVGDFIVTVVNSAGCNEALLWHKGTVQLIGPPPYPYNSLGAGSLNNRDEVVGSLFSNLTDPNGNSLESQFLWQNGRITLLPTFPGAESTYPGGATAASINDLGVIAGTSGSVNGAHAVLWRNNGTTIVDLGVCPNFLYSGAGTLNDLGFVTGSCQVTQVDGVYMNLFAPAVWHNEQLTVLPLPATGAPSALAAGINILLHQVVGAQQPGNGQAGDAGTALLWQDNIPYDLNTLIAPDDPLKPYVKLLQAGGITRRGQIMAIGEDSRVPNNQGVEFLLTPVK